MSEYVSVEEFAAATGRPARTVRHWAASGRLPGVLSVGRAWVLPSELIADVLDGVYPLRHEREAIEIELA